MIKYNIVMVFHIFTIIIQQIVTLSKFSKFSAPTIAFLAF